jgi:hypothetical protein
MSFLAPWMLAGGIGAAAIPIALHFFYRSRYRRVPWAAMRFLLLSIEQTSRRLRFQELLLLFLRVALLLLLGLALARPSFVARGSSGRGDAVDAVLLFDTSFSMGAREGSTTRWQRAKDAALAILDQLPRQSTVHVVTCADRAALRGPQTPSNLEQSRQLVRSLELTDLSTDLLPGVREALAVLERGHSPNKELYLFSDMQRLGWEEQSAPLVETMRQLDEKATVYLVRCGTRTPRNVAVVGLAPQWGLPRAGERTAFTVLVRNAGTEPVRDLTLSLSVNGRGEDGDTRPVLDENRQQQIGPGDTRPFVVAAKLDRPGRNVLTATLKGDDLDADNRLDQMVFAHEHPRALVVDGTPNAREAEKAASFNLVWALKPIPAEVVSPADANARHLADKDFCVLVNAPVDAGPAGRLSREFLEALTEFVSNGRGLVIFGGSLTRPEAYNQLLLERDALLPTKVLGVHVAPEDRPLSFDRQSATTHPFAKFREDGAYQSVDRCEVRQTLRLEEGGESQVLLRYTNGWPAVVGRKRFGEGEVLLFATAANDANWNDWNIDISFVPFVQSVVGRLLEGTTAEHNRRAGEPLHWHPPASEAEAVHLLVRPDGSRERLGLPEATGGRSRVTAADTPRAGVYRIQPEGAEPAGAVFAVTPDLRESEDLSSLSDKDLDELLGFRAVHVTAGEDVTDTAMSLRAGREWTLAVLACVAALVLVEAVFAWFCSRAW